MQPEFRGNSGNRGEMKQFLQAVAIAVSVVAALVIGAIIILPFIVTDMIPEQPFEAAELDTIQAAIDTFMTDNALTEITPSTSGAGGEKINLMGAQFHPTLNLELYLRDTPTLCYQWASNGGIISQYDVNADGNCAIDTEKCSRSAGGGYRCQSGFGT